MPRSARGRGQALVEFSLVIPIFLALLFGMLDLGRVIWANDALANAAREAARFAVVHGAASACPVGPPGPETVVPPPSSACPHPSPSKDAIRDVARSFAIAAGMDLAVEVCYGEGCTGDTDAAGATNERGTTVSVTVRGTVPMLTGSVVGMNAFGVSGESTMLVNH